MAAYDSHPTRLPYIGPAQDNQHGAGSILYKENAWFRWWPLLKHKCYTVYQYLASEQPVRHVLCSFHHTLQRYNTENSKQKKWNCAATVPIPTFMFLWAIYMYIPKIGLPILLQDNRWTERGNICIDRSQTHEWGNRVWGLAIPFLGIHKSEFLCNAEQIVLLCRFSSYLNVGAETPTFLFDTCIFLTDKTIAWELKNTAIWWALNT
jgi:hypothetical protein